jgi:ADP-ribosyl-[dinitrogen reductase] hydrolase
MTTNWNAMIGALVGDAAGATLEGARKVITEDMVDRALSMPGGGWLQVGPGQITDDGELTLTLWNCLKDMDPLDGFPFDQALQGYAAWYDSCPFDIGQTCSLAFEVLSEVCHQQKERINIFTTQEKIDIKRKIVGWNNISQSNGALMRSTAIATWIAPYLDSTPEQAAEYAMEDATLSHPHPICQETNAIYVYTLVNLLRGISPSQALDYTNEFVIMNDFSPEVKHWYFTESVDISAMEPTIQIGHVRWGFVLAFYFLRHHMITYEDAIRITLQKGGDTDTNACIVGGMVASYQTVPLHLQYPIFQFDCTKQGHRRPSEYSVQQVLHSFAAITL